MTDVQHCAHIRDSVSCLSEGEDVVTKGNPKTYNSGNSPVVTHLTTNPPVNCLSRAEQTGSRVVNVLWSYVVENLRVEVYELVKGKKQPPVEH